MRRLSNPLKRVIRRWRAKPTPQSGQGLSLRVEHDLHVLTPVESITASFAETDVQGAIAAITPGEQFSEAVMRARLAGRTAGENRPDWHDGTGGGPANAVTVSRIRNALHTPEFGAVIDRHGVVMKASVGEALYLSPDLAILPHVTITDGEALMRAPKKLPRLATGAVFMAWGGRFNYGHFLLDCLPSLAVLELAGLLDVLRPIAPPLNAWQREGIRLMMGPGPKSRPLEIAEPLIAID
ncbi:MAG: hypothetical protein KKC14_06020, partial [Alphaproteobacteria bacterium]|nr:hypothetical protein [Alphaproteobacteria bacterium]